jgi:hypothetical protein
MSDELSVVEKVVEEVLIDLMKERIMSISTCIQASSMRAMPASPSTTRGAGPSQSSDEKRTKNRDDLANAKLIPTILPTYIPPLRGVVNHNSVPRYFEYTLVTAYLLKGIRTVRVDQDNIAMLKFSDFNLGER